MMLRLGLKNKKMSYTYIFDTHTHTFPSYRTASTHTLPAFLPAGSPAPQAAIATANQKALEVSVGEAAHIITIICRNVLAVEPYAVAGPSSETMTEKCLLKLVQQFLRDTEIKVVERLRPQTY